MGKKSDVSANAVTSKLSGTNHGRTGKFKRTRTDVSEDEDKPEENPLLRLYPLNGYPGGSLISLEFNANVYELVYAFLMFESLLRQIYVATKGFGEHVGRMTTIENSTSSEGGLQIGPPSHEMRLGYTGSKGEKDALQDTWYLAMNVINHFPFLRSVRQHVNGEPLTSDKLDNAIERAKEMTLKEWVDAILTGGEGTGKFVTYFTPLTDDRMAKTQQRKCIELHNGGHYTLEMMEVRLLMFCLKEALAIPIDDPDRYRWHTKERGGGGKSVREMNCLFARVTGRFSSMRMAVKRNIEAIFENGGSATVHQ